jgi:predicted nucleic acid-binding protein
MIRAVLADAGPLYAAVDEGDERHQRASKELFELDLERRVIVVSYSTLLEAHKLVQMRLGMNAAQTWLTFMADATLINPEPEDYRQAIARVKNLPDQKISLFDALLGVLASRLGLQVWTHDHYFDVMRIPVWRGRNA